MMGYAINAVPTKLNSFELRKPFPQYWAGKTDCELQLVTGVPGARFCHNQRFIVTAQTMYDAIELARIASYA